MPLLMTYHHLISCLQEQVDKKRTVLRPAWRQNGLISAPVSGAEFNFAVTVDDNSKPVRPSSDYGPEHQQRFCSALVSEEWPAAG